MDLVEREENQPLMHGHGGALESRTPRYILKGPSVMQQVRELTKGAKDIPPAIDST